MSLNIKDRETHELAAALAKATGESMTKAVTLLSKSVCNAFSVIVDLMLPLPSFSLSVRVVPRV